MSTEEIIELDVELVTHTKDLDISIDVDREQYDVTLVLSKTDVDDITSEEILITEQLELLLDKHSLQIEFEEVDEVDVANLVIGKFIKGVGVPDGGNAGDVLVKLSNDSYDTKWVSGVYGGDKNFCHLQGEASAIWVINHYLNKFPAVTIFDSAGEVVMGDIQYVDLNTVRIVFEDEFAGKATLN